MTVCNNLKKNIKYREFNDTLVLFYYFCTRKIKCFWFLWYLKFELNVLENVTQEKMSVSLSRLNEYSNKKLWSFAVKSLFD